MKSCKLKKERQYNGQKKKDNQIQWPKEKGQPIIYKTLHKKLMIEQHETHSIGSFSDNIFNYPLLEQFSSTTKIQ